MANRYLVVSDLHLADHEDHTDGWKWYKHSRYDFDDSFAALVERFRTTAGEGERCVLVLNGDVFDFDLISKTPASPPWRVSRAERRRGLEPTEEKAVWKLEQALADHPRFPETLARFCSDGHEVVYIRGNHDSEFHFPRVQAAMTLAVREAAVKLGLEVAREPIRYEPWFFYIPGEIYVEHGNQYDYYSSFAMNLSPTVREGKKEVIALPMGDLSNRYLMNFMGYFNPHAGDFILNLFAYLYHWLKHYAFSRRSLMFNWFFGSLVVMRKLLLQKQLVLRKLAGQEMLLRETALRQRIAFEKLKKLDRLRRPPITNRLYRIMREFWIDRVIISLFMAGGTVALALVPIPLWIKLMVPLSSFPLLYFIYEYFARSESIFTVEQEFPRYARAVARLLPVQIVCFGHTHVPRMIPLSKKCCFVDTGTWAPIFSRDDPLRLADGYRNYLEVRFDIGGEAQVKFQSWLSGQQPSWR